jgi:3-oxoadipate enol-lactonase
VEHILMLNESNISYDVSAGTGIDVIFLHGFPFNRRMWKSQVEQFGQEYRVITPDFRGYGNSSKCYPWTITHLADDIKKLIDRLMSKKVILCGLSMGGYVALEFAASYPELLQSLILCDTKAAADTNQEKNQRAQAMLDISTNGPMPFARSFAQKCIHENSVAEEIAAESITKNGIYELLSGMMALSARKDQTETLSRIECPTLVLCGDKDKITPVSESEFLYNNIIQSTMHIIPDAGHLSNIQNPENFNLHLQKFLATCKESTYQQYLQ